MSIWWNGTTEKYGTQSERTPIQEKSYIQKKTPTGDKSDDKRLTQYDFRIGKNFDLWFRFEWYAIVGYEFIVIVKRLCCKALLTDFVIYFSPFSFDFHDFTF